MSVRTSDAQLDRVITQHHAQRESDFPTDDDRARAIFERVIAAERGVHETSVLRRAVSPRRIVGVAAALAIVLGGTAGILAIVSNHAAPAHTTKSSGGFQLVDFATATDGDIVARITDPLAAKSQLDAVFEQHGLDIQVNVLPVSPSLVGTIIEDTMPANANVRPLEGGTCIGQGQAGTTVNANECPIGLVIPADFHGSGSVYIGRSAQPGEAYESSGNGFSPGEVLHCSGLLSAPISAAQTFLTAKDLTATRWFVTDSAERPVSGGDMVQSDVAPTTGYIVGGIASSANNVLLTIDSTLPTDPGFATQVAAANAGC